MTIKLNYITFNCHNVFFLFSQHYAEFCFMGAIYMTRSDKMSGRSQIKILEILTDPESTQNYF